MRKYETKIILYSKRTNKGFPIKIRIRNKWKQKYEFVGTGYYAEKSDWDLQQDKLKKSYPNYAAVMDKIDILENEIRLKYSNEEIQAVSSKPLTAKRSNYYFQEYFHWLKKKKRYSSLGIAKAMYKLYFKFNNNESVPLISINKKHLIDFFEFLEEQNIGLNTRNIYMKRFVAFLNYLSTHHNIFIKKDFLKNSYTKVERKEPKIIEELLLIKAMLHNIVTIEKITNKQFKSLLKLIVSIGLSGIRASDLHLLKWSNFYLKREVLEAGEDVIVRKEIYCKYKMLKTGNELNLRVPRELLKYLVYFTNNRYTQKAINEFDNFLLMKLTTMKYNNRKFNHQKFSRELTMIRDKYQAKNKKEFEVEKDNMYAKAIILQIEVVKTGLIKDTYLTGDINPEIYDSATEEERHLYISAKTNNYNRMLKVTCEKLGIDHISSHQARFTFSDLAINNGIDVYELSQLLNHSNVAITQNYMKRFKSKKLADKSKPVFKYL